jgi:hypothetical protein
MAANNAEDTIITSFIAGIIEVFRGRGITIPPIFNPLFYFCFALLLHSTLKMPRVVKGCNFLEINFRCACSMPLMIQKNFY